MKIYFRSVQACNSRVKYETILELNQVKTKYKDIGFTVIDYHVNIEFDHLHDF